MTNSNPLLSKDSLCRFYIDCEFNEHEGSLISMAIVPEHGNDGIHITLINGPPVTSSWVRENVLPILTSHKADINMFCDEKEVGQVIKEFIGECEHPIIIADSPVDIGRFCKALSTGTDGNWESTSYPKMTFEVYNVDCYPTNLEGAVQHNAWYDAMALRFKLVGY